MSVSGTILLVGYHAEVFSEHSELLREAGYQVTALSSLSAALGAVGPGTASLLILAADTPIGDRRRIEAEARRRNKAIRIVLYYRGEREKDVFASAFLDANGSPEELVQTAATLLAKQSTAS